MEKRYYWLKLQRDFFSSVRIKKLRKMKRGDTLCIIYLKMQLKALTKGGMLEYKGIEPTPAEEFALDLDESVKDVQIVLDFLIANDLIEQQNGGFWLPYVEENTGSETASTQRWRDWKRRNVGEMLDSNKTPTYDKRSANVEKELEKEKDIYTPQTPRRGKLEKNTLKNYKVVPYDPEACEQSTKQIERMIQEL